MPGEVSAPKDLPLEQLRVGTLAYDTQRKAIGVVMDVTWGPVYLRPPNGGIEWCACREDVRPATVTDRLRPALRELNVRSTRGGL
ncbi:hypothetical protein JNUCC64_20000 [Streptomyces sp. JNUCC 64]